MEKPDVIIWKAYLRIMYSAFQNYEDLEKSEIDKINYVQNPFGFKVMSYEVSYAGKPEKACPVRNIRGLTERLVSDRPAKF